MKDLFPLRLLLRPAEFLAVGSSSGWAWPAGLYLAATAASTTLLLSLPPAFLAEVAGGAALSPGRGWGWYFAVGVPSGLAFNLFFCAAAAGFAGVLRGGRLALRLAVLTLAVGGYAALFLLPLPGPLRLAAIAGAAAWTALAARAGGRKFANYFHTALTLSVLLLAADAAGAAAAAAAAPGAYTAVQLVFALLTLGYLARAGEACFGLTRARAGAAALWAMAAAMAFFSSLGAAGLLSRELVEAMLII